ncbi:MAG: hypothetical protein AAB799_00560 [Patescibacteria group bacterium]
MTYLLGLVLILGLIFGVFNSYLPFGLNSANLTRAVNGIVQDFKNKTYEYLFPRSKTEILVDSLNSDYDLLDKFFSNPSDILKSKDIPESKKAELKKAIKSFNKTKEQINALGTEVKNSKPGVIEALVKKALNLDQPDIGNNSYPDPTHIPPTCNLVCGN